MRRWMLIGAVIASGGCHGGQGARGPEPAANSERWRAVLGCYQMNDQQFRLDSLPDLKLNADRAGVRRALFAPRQPIVGGYWFVTDRGAVWVFRHDGLWGSSYEFAVKGDSLVGRRHVRTDVPNANNPPEPAGAVRTSTCQVQESA